MTTSPSRARLALVPLVVFVNGCGDDGEGKVEVDARGAIDAFGRVDERSLLAAYSPELDDESCEVLDGRSECVLVRCNPEEAAPLEDAGDVTVGDEALEIAADNSYAVVVPGELVPGERLAMRASGSSSVPAHSGEVLVPERAELSQMLEEPLVLDPAEDFVVTWRPVESDRVVFRATFDGLSIECTTSGMFGQITVAARLIDALPNETPGAYSITNENLVEKTVSNWRVWFGAHHTLVAGSVELAPPP
jgi:hypothetical protein